jgi:hypothetical protein
MSALMARLSYGRGAIALADQIIINRCIRNPLRAGEPIEMTEQSEGTLPSEKVLRVELEEE